MDLILILTRCKSHGLGHTKFHHMSPTTDVGDLLLTGSRRGHCLGARKIMS